MEERIEDEPYWADLSDLLTWGSEHVQSMLLSCLSAHAALTVFDGIERQRLTSKCTGVFPQEVDPAHPLAAGVEPRITLPHSRTSTVAEEHLRARRISTSRCGPTPSGGPWRPGRWAGPRWCSSRATPSTTLPACCGSTTATSGATPSTSVTSCRCCRCTAWARRTGTSCEHLHEAVIGGKRDPELVAAYPFDKVGARAPWPWHAVAQRLYANWVNGFSKRSD